STDATIGEREALVSLAWPVMLDNACQPLPSVVTAWGPVAGLTDEDYVIQVTTLAISSASTAPPVACDAATGMHYLELNVEDQANWDLVHEVETSPSGLRSSSGDEVDAGSFGLTLTSTARIFAAGEPINAETLLMYTGRNVDSTVDLSSNGIGTLFSIEQIDGDIRYDSDALILPCADRVNIGSESGIVNYLRFPGEWSADDPNAAFYEQYTSDELLTLPPGHYLIRARFEAAISQDCSGEQLDLQTGVVIEVR
ncbi:MAG TPA: hypothetical protein VEX62_08635, partial [Candidatus Limnocylindrales bacterium]|nr:hypothetical protein [Candidatus Limnocylindrales bacterium]